MSACDRASGLPKLIHPRTGELIQTTIRAFDYAGIRFTFATYEASNGEIIGNGLLTWTDRSGEQRSVASTSLKHAISVVKVINGKR